MDTALVLFNRDLRIHDHPALTAAARADRVLPLFVFDDRLIGSRFAAPNRIRFMLESLRDLAERIEARGAKLIIRRGDPVAAALELARTHDATEIHVSADWSAFARRREAGLAAACDEADISLEAHPGVTIVPPGEVTPVGGDHFKVFSPYRRAWQGVELRPALGPPRKLAIPGGVDPGELPALEDLTKGSVSPDLLQGGETEGRRRMHAFAKDLEDYTDGQDDLPGDRTSRLSSYLRFGCLSPLEVMIAARKSSGSADFVSQLCWRDFHHQVLAVNPDLPRHDYRPRRDRWSRSKQALDAWKEGRTGYPIVDAAMRQLAQEGFMHNRARLISSSFLTKDLYIDWREGAWHFWDLLTDGDIANNAGNWQWVAGTGNDTRPHRMFNPLRQAERFDPNGDYVRRYVPELSAIDGRAVHQPWNLGPLERGLLDYPEPIVDHADAVAAFRAKRASG